MANDLELLRRYATRHDPDAFSELVQRYAGMVYGVCLRVTRDPHDAEDTAQECFLELSRHAALINTSLAGWLHLKAISRARDAVRRAAARKRVEEIAMTARQENPDMNWAEIAPIVDQALSELPDELRAAVLMHYFRGTPQAEIAQELGVNQSTVSRRINDGLAQLREQLARAGVAVPASSLVVLLGANALTPAPLAVTAAALKIAATGAAKAAVAGTAGASTAKALPFLAKMALACVVATAAVGIGVRMSQDSARPAPTPAAALIKSPAPNDTPKEDAPPVQPTVAAPAPAAQAERPDLLGKMAVVDGEWQDADNGRSCLGPKATLVSTEAFEADALTVEFDARAADAGQGTPRIECVLSPYKNRAEEVAGKAPEFHFQLNYGKSWCTLAERPAPKPYKRDAYGEEGWGDLIAKTNEWYHVKAESFGKLQRLWINGVPVRELQLEKAPEKLFVWLSGNSAPVTFRKLNIYRPSEEDARKSAQPSDLLAAPYQQVQDVLAKFPDTVVHEGSIVLGEQNQESGLSEVAFKGGMGTPGELHGVSFRRSDSVLHPDTWGVDFKVQDAAQWSPLNRHVLEVEYLDRGDGVVIVNYNCWCGLSKNSAEFPRKNTGKWVKHRFELPDAAFNAKGGWHFWIGAFRSNAEPDLYIHALKAIEISKPKEAYQAAADELTRRLKLHQNDWAAAHYKFRLAQLLAYHLNREKDALELLASIEKDAPASEATALYREMCNSSQAWVIGKSEEAKKLQSDF